MLELEKKLTTWLFGLGRSKKRLIQITFDGWVASISILLAFFMRLESINFLYKIDTYFSVLIGVTATLVIFAARGQYDNVTRHISTEVVYNIAIGSAISCAVLLSCIFLLELTVPRSVPLIFAMLLCLFATAIRFFIRALGQRNSKFLLIIALKLKVKLLVVSQLPICLKSLKKLSNWKLKFYF
jgi:FlaA1/EpsC-like NDP-sugar epimerase